MIKRQGLAFLIRNCNLYIMKLIIGIGNPDKEYLETRHNVGFIIVDKIAKESEAEFEFDKKIDAEIAKGRFNDLPGRQAGKPVILMKPHTYVNKSGEAVKKLKNKLKIKPADIVVIHDDLDIEFGHFKVSFEKNSGGHKGVQNIIDNLKTTKFWRLRIGTANKKVDTARDQGLKEKKELIKDFVLAKFSPLEHEELKKVIKQALERLALSL
jgi:peptidyl-tRNA hydrolase, PTH1 family